jgi:hypothetical protein
MKNILERYFIQLILKSVNGSEEVIVLGYFDTPAEFREIIRKLGKLVSVRSTLDYVIHSLPNKKPLIEGHSVEVDSNAVVAINSDRFDLKSDEGITEFVKKHFITPYKGSQRHYWVEIILEHDTLAEKPMIAGYFSAINEFFEILSVAGSKIMDGGDFAFQIEEIFSGKMISSRIYKMKANAEICMPDDPPHYFNLRNEKDLQNLCFYLWETDFAE